MSLDDLVVMTKRSDPPSITLARAATIVGVPAAQLVRWAWVGRIPAPEQVGRRFLWRRSDVVAVKHDGPAMVGFYPSLAHYDGIRMLEALRVAELRARGVKLGGKGTRSGKGSAKGVRS